MGTAMEESLKEFDEEYLALLVKSENVTQEFTKLICLALETKPMLDKRLGYCSWVWDEVMCWPPSPPGNTSVRACLEDFKGVHYDTSNNATKQCFPNGTWANYTNYLSCLNNSMVPFSNYTADSLPGTEITTLIYIFGYVASLVALFIAVWIFMYFKDLRCLRNTIHINLMCTYILADAMWIINAGVQMYMNTDNTSCILLVFFLHYFHLTNFFWMFVEGLYLYMLVVETFTRENIKLRTYVVLGWGLPFLVMVAWSIPRWLFPSETNSESRLPGSISSQDPINVKFEQDKLNVMEEAERTPMAPAVQEMNSCSWMTPSSSDWIYSSSALLVLAVNLIFLIMIMWVLITKLRSTNNVETQQYRKATKALVVLIPLLGITYILILVGPNEGDWANSFAYFRALLLSTQGLTVALFYCFLNTEVQNTVRHHFSRWKESRDIGHRRYTYSKDWSPNTRTESIRLCSKHEVAPYKKRESTVSESTTLTLVGYGGGSRLSNGSTAPAVTVRAPVSPFLEPPREKAV